MVRCITLGNKTESILCAAIWLKSASVYPHQPINIPHGLVYCGYRHCSILQQISRIDRISLGITQGFLTSHNRFVDRKEAYHIALNNQIIDINTCRNNTLISENVY
jgi:hypothetical protein